MWILQRKVRHFGFYVNHSQFVETAFKNQISARLLANEIHFTASTKSPKVLVYYYSAQYTPARTSWIDNLLYMDNSLHNILYWMYVHLDNYKLNWFEVDLHNQIVYITLLNWIVSKLIANIFIIHWLQLNLNLNRDPIRDSSKLKLSITYINNKKILS